MVDSKEKFAKCNDKRKCFARFEGRCMVLNEVYKPGTCPFCKADREITKGEYYPRYDKVS